VNLILAFYPRAWRRRYSDEVAQLLDDLRAERPRSQLKQVLGLLLNAPPIHIAHRPVAASILAFSLGGAAATIAVPSDVATTPKQKVIVATQRASGPQLLIIRGPHTTIMTHDLPAQGHQIRSGAQRSLSVPRTKPVSAPMSSLKRGSTPER
jgi:hypothetical protein